MSVESLTARIGQNESSITLIPRVLTTKTGKILSGFRYYGDESLSSLDEAWKFLKPGGPVWGLNPKKSFITPIDFVPVVGPANKLNQGRKLWSKREAFKRLGQGLAQVPGDIILLLGASAALASLKDSSSSPGGSGAPSGKSPSAPTAQRHRRCPSGHRWDQSQKRCVRIRSRKR